MLASELLSLTKVQRNYYRYLRVFRCRLSLILAALLIGSASTGTSIRQLGRVNTRWQSNRPLPNHKFPLSTQEIRAAEQNLADLGYWTGPVDGVLDPASRQALIAFQKIEGRKRTGKLTTQELQALRTAKRVLPRDGNYDHIEIDLTRQVLFSVDGNGLVSKILPVSTGSGKLFSSEGWTRRAVTPQGRFTITYKTKGWRKSPLGLLYYPNYIVGGIAIHGNPSVPVYPASHGCIRIPMFAAKEFSEFNSVGTVVLVYESEYLE